MDRRTTTTDRARRRPRPAGTHRARGAILQIILLGAAALPAQVAAQAVLEAAPLPAPFSAGKPGMAIPPGWEPVKLSDKKKPTVYTLVDGDGTVVLHASAVAAASGLAQFTVFDVRSAPIVEWRWKVSALIEGADNRYGATDDSPVRLMFAFDGDKSRLPFVERTVYFLAKQLSGRDLPYALLEYVWANKAPVGTVIEHPYTTRVKMLVLASGPGGVGKWQSLSRNVHDDYRQAFGEEPGALTGIGVLTDTDNTGGSVEAWYGDIRLRAADR
jgi:hypothetical protein